MARALILVAVTAALLAAALGALPSTSSRSDTSASSPADTSASVPPDGTSVAATQAQAAACAETASATHPIERLSGPDRWGTAACASQAAYPDGAETVLLARGDDAGGFADALAGTVLAHAQLAPILLTAPSDLPEVTRAELARLQPDDVLVLGGPAAIADRVVAEVEAVAGRAQRVAGPDRFATAAAIAARLPASDRAFVVNGFRPPDALVAGAVAARAGAPLLLVTDTAVPEATRAALAGTRRITVVGGFGVVGEAAEAALRGIAHLRRVSGADRSETAASVARALPAAEIIHVVSGDDRHLVDALAAGWLAALPGGGPVLYAGRDAPTGGADRWLRLGGLAADRPLRLIGGPAVLSPALVTVLEARYDEAARGGPPAQLRAFWVHLFDGALKSRGGIEAMLDAATRSKLNTVMVQVSRRHDAYYGSEVLPRTPDPAMPTDLDLLARLVPAAHDRGLAVHAWFAVTPTWHPTYTDVGMPPGHVLREHGPSSGDPWMTDPNDPAFWYLDPGVPAVQDHIAAMIREVVERYGVDGIHLDYLRYDQASTHPTSTARWQARGGTSYESADAWRRRQTADLTRRIFLEVAEADPAVEISAAVIAQGQDPAAAGGFAATRAFRERFQDWPTWFAEGLVDRLVPMAYFRESRSDQAAWFDGWVAFTAGLEEGTQRGDAAIGQASFLNTVAGSLAQLDGALGATGGAVLFSYQQDTACPTGVGCTPVEPRGRLLASLAGGAFASPAAPPDLPARTRPDSGHLLVQTADGVTVSVTPALGLGDAPPPRDADGTGKAGFVWLAPGQWTVSAPGFAPQVVTVEPGRVARVQLGGG